MPQRGPMAHPVRLVAAAGLFALASCAPGGHMRLTPDGGDGSPDGGPSGPSDADGDGISDANEGRGTSADTDGDGTPDYLDDDSDGDGIPDAVEAGSGGDASRAPVDSDGDGTPDFRDLDSDDNGIFDQVEGWGDADGDGDLDHSDWDNDGDNISDLEEIGGDPAAPRDSDGDGTPDFMDVDSDADTISDLHDGPVDTDGDGTPDSLDLDSDDDGLPDAVEAGDADLATRPVDTDGDGIFDFRDPDSDNDGLSDRAEVEAGTSPTSADSDGDGVSDLVEVAADTDPLDGTDSPRTRGDFVFLVPFEAPPDPPEDTLSFSTDIQFADVYFLMDTTGSMSGAITGLKTTLTGTIIPGVDAEIPDALFGVGSFRDYPYDPYGSRGDRPYTNLQGMTDDPALAQAAVNTMSAGGGYDGPESHVPALHAVATGCGDGGGTYGIPDDPGGACTDPGLIGYPHFRAGAVPIVVLFSDAPFHNGPGGTNSYGAVPGVAPPTYDAAVAALLAIHARVIGVSSGSYGRPNLEQLVRDTGTVDATGSPFIYDQSTAAFGELVVDAIAAVSQQIPMDISAVAVDDPSDAVDALVFVESIVPTPDPAAPCSTGLAVDGLRYLDVLPGSTVCFDIVPRQNDTVPPTREPQVYTATIQVWGDDVTILDERLVYFLVPPVVEDPGAPG